MEASWDQAENALMRLGVTDEDSLLVDSFLAHILSISAETVPFIRRQSF
jgi:hypothetical protein